MRMVVSECVVVTAWGSLDVTSKSRLLPECPELR
jgi:hypothetical protein